MDILGRGNCLPTGGDRFGEFINAFVGIDKLFISLRYFFRDCVKKNFHLQNATFCAVKQTALQVSVPNVRQKKEE